jgi:hypothetical protein
MKNTCAGPECTKDVWSKDLCSTHYQQQRRGKELSPILKQRNLWENGEKICPACGVKKVETEYGNLPNGRRQSHCLECERHRDADRRASKKGQDLATQLRLSGIRYSRYTEDGVTVVRVAELDRGLAEARGIQLP